MQRQLLAALPLCAALLGAARAAGVEKVRIEVVNHMRCTVDDAPKMANRKVDFPPMSEVVAERDDTAAGSNCFRLADGTVRRKTAVRIGNMQVYNNVTLGRRNAKMACENAAENRCGGVGSCFYCDLCAPAGGRGRRQYVTLRGSSSEVRCPTQIDGVYRGLELEVCLPPLADDAAAQHAVFDDFFAQNSTAGFDMTITSYIFNQPRKRRWVPSDDNGVAVLKKSEYYVGCHVVEARVSKA